MSAHKKPVDEYYILDRVAFDHIKGCWLWTRSTDSGYGVIGSRGFEKHAHRQSYRLFVGEIPEGIQVLHKCDVRECCNPEHLFLGTIGDNMRDRTAKNRQAKGAGHGMAKLTIEQVDEIRKRAESSYVLEREFPVSSSAIRTT